MSVRFEILVNGVRAPVSGIYGDGLLSANVSYFKRKDDDAEVALSVSGNCSITPRSARGPAALVAGVD